MSIQSARSIQRRPALKKSYLATESAVPHARRDLVRFAEALDAGEETIEALRLAASEALSNVVLHAYPEGGGQIHVTAMRTDSDLWVMIADDGAGLQLDRRSPGLGLGLGLIQHMADEFAIVERPAGGLEMRMRFSVKSQNDAQAYSAAYERGSYSSASRPASPRFSTTM
jgi:anti-sigma regulatory factor (Ser/Thr protein kinase)